MTAPEYEEEWEKCVEMALDNRVIATTRALELAHMCAPEGVTWHIPISACLIFGEAIKVGTHAETKDQANNS